MEYTRVRKTNLARNTSEIIRNVLRGQPVIIESHGKPEVVIVEVIYYLILRAVVNFHAGNRLALDPNGPSNAEFSSLTEQDRYNRAMDYYMAEGCSTGRIAELLQISVADMHERFNELGVPLFL